MDLEDVWMILLLFGITAADLRVRLDLFELVMSKTVTPLGSGRILLWFEVRLDH